MVVENLGEGTDLVQSSVTHTLAANVENLTLTGANAIDGTGNALNNVLTGNSAANTLSGAAGDDQYRFGVSDGADRIVETTGNDRIVFGVGLTSADITATRTAGVVKLILNGADSISFDDLGGGVYAVEQFEFANGSVLGAAWVNSLFPNAAPTASNLSAAEAYTEDAAKNLVDIVVADADSTNLTATLTLSNVAAGSLNTGTAGAVTSTYNAGTGVWSAAGAKADVNTLLAALTFTPTANFNANFTIATSVSDGVAPAVAGSKAFTGTAVNDAPTASNLSAAETYSEDTTLNLVDIVATDIDSANTTVTLTLSNAAAGSLTVGTSSAVTSTYNAGTGVWNAAGVKADVNTLLAALTFTPAANFNANFSIATSVSDGVAPTITGSKAFTGTAVNDAPTGAVTIAGTATQGQTLTASNSLADVDGLGTIAYQWKAAGIAISGAIASTLVLAAAQVGKAITVSAGYTDGKGTVESVASTATALVSAPVNAASTATNLSAAEAYTEDTAKNLVDIVVADTDSANLTVTLTLSNVLAGSLNTGASGAVTSTHNTATGVWSASGATANVNTLLAALTFTPAANFNANFTIATSVSDAVAPAITGSKAFTGTAVNDAPTGAVTIAGTATQGQTLTASNTLADVDGLGTIGYQWKAAGIAISGATASTLVLATAQVGKAVTVSAGYTDAKGTVESVASAATAAVSATANAAPTATNLRAAETYTEDTAKNLVDIVVADTDSANLTATLTLSTVAAGSLNTGTSGAVTSTYNAGTGVWSASGAKVDVNTLLAALTFTPAANFNANFAIATSVSDGVAPAITGTKAFTGTAVNDAPTGAVTIAGVAAQGQTLATTNTLADVDGLGTIAYQWKAAGVAIPGATASTLVLAAAQVGKAITVSASYTDAKGTAESVASAATAAVTTPAFVGTAGADTLNGTTGADQLVGLAGNDTYAINNAGDVILENLNEGTDLVNASISYTLANNVENLSLTGTSAINGTGNTLDNALTGNSAANTLSGNAGADVLDGKAGADILIGGTGNDTYWLGRGWGNDTIQENDATAGNTDIARFDAGIATDQLWFQHVGNNLEVSIIGTADKFTLSNWYTGSANHVEQFKTSNGKTLLDSQVQSLVSAMAAFSPPAAGQTTLPASYATTLAPVIAANWV